MKMGRPPKYSFDKHFFDVIDSDEKAYWLGFIAADGCVTARSLLVTLSAKDKDHLAKFKTALKADNPLRTFINSQGNETTSFGVHSIEFVANLARYYIVPRKTHSFSMRNIPNKFVSAFIRGEFDGDGCAHNRTSASGGGVWIIQISGTEKFMDQIAARCAQNGIDRVFIKPHHGSPASRVLHISRIDQVCRFRDWIYKNASIFLDRKKEILDRAGVLPDRICPVCDNKFTPRYRNRGLYCSRKCYLKVYYRTHPEKWR